MGNQLPHVVAFKDKGYLLKNKRHDASTVIRTFIVSNMIKTTRCDKSLTP